MGKDKGKGVALRRDPSSSKNTSYKDLRASSRDLNAPIRWSSDGGLNNSQKHHCLRAFLRKHDVSLFGILLSNPLMLLSLLLFRNFADWGIAHNFAPPSGGRIATLWRKDRVTSDVLHPTGQLLHSSKCFQICSRVDVMEANYEASIKNLCANPFDSSICHQVAWLRRKVFLLKKM